MTERRDNPTLSTADMVAATRHESQANSPSPAGDERGFVQQEAHADGPAVTRTNGGTAAPPRPAGAAGTPTGGKAAPLLAGDQAQSFHSRWEEIQTGFVDEPRHAVEQADQLVAEVIKRVAEIFADERSRLEAQWSRGDKVDTEALRVALTRYRSFFERLLST